MQDRSLLKRSDGRQVSPRVHESAVSQIPLSMESPVVIDAADVSKGKTQRPIASPIHQRGSNLRKITVYRLNTAKPSISRIQIDNVKKSVCPAEPPNLSSAERLFMTIPSHSITTSSPVSVTERKRALADGDNQDDTLQSMNYDDIQLQSNAEEEGFYRAIARNEKIPITCRKKHAILYKSKLGSGKNGKCIYFENAWYTPSEFEHHCGLEGSKDWKRSLRYGGRAMLSLIQKGYLRPHASSCTCGICSDDASIRDPIKYYTPVSRRKRTSGFAFPNNQGLLNTPTRLQECSFEINQQQTDVITSLNSLNEVTTPIPNELLDLLQATDTPIHKIINYIHQAVNRVAADDRNSWEKLNSQANEIFDKYAKLQEAIEKAKLKCEERRNNLLQDIITTLKTCDNSTDRIPLKSARLEKSPEHQDEVPDDEATEICQACGQPANSECTGCHKATYCSTECQEKDWNAGHRDACRQLLGQD